MKIKFLGVIIARLDSQRLPKKALTTVAGREIIDFVLSRAKKIEGLNKIVIATSTRNIDNDLEIFGQANKIDCFRGNYENVAKRVLDCAIKFDSQYIIRINADSPFLDYKLVSLGISKVINNELNILSNIIPRTFPYGISVEILETQILKDFIEKFSKSDQEHMMNYFYSNWNGLSLRTNQIISEQNYSNNIRLVVDTKEDLKIFSKMVDHLNETIDDASLDDIVEVYNRVANEI